MKKKPISIEEISFHNVRKVHPALRGYLGYCLHKLASIIKVEFGMAFIEQQLHGPHLAILSLIASDDHDVNQNLLCEETGIDKASMVKIIDHLESLSYIERVNSKQDRRIKNLVLTKKGTLILSEAHKLRNNLEEKFLSSLNKSEIETFKKLLLRILDHQQRN